VRVGGQEVDCQPILECSERPGDAGNQSTIDSQRSVDVRDEMFDAEDASSRDVELDHREPQQLRNNFSGLVLVEVGWEPEAQAL
jgi:hypothetical protein